MERKNSAICANILPPDHGRSNPAHMTDISGRAVFDWNSAFATCGCLHFSNSPSIIGKTIMARDRTRSVHRIPALAICLPALGLPIVRISHRRGSLIPLPLSERREADHTSSKLWTGRYTHHTPHFTVSTNLISFTPHPLSRGLLDKPRPCQSPTGQRDIKAWGYCI